MLLVALAACAAPAELDTELEAVACAGQAPLRRLNALEYDNTVHDLLGYQGSVSAAFPADPVLDGFDDRADALTISPLLAEHYMRAAELLADDALGHLDELAPCPVDSPGEEARACADSFIREFGLRAYRRPLDPEQVASLLDTYAAGSDAAGSYAGGIRWVLERMLQSPQFLYRIEIMGSVDNSGTKARIDDWELASRLSYLLWRSMPDAELFALADAGELQTAEAIEAQARRMLDDPRARETILDFHRQWLDLRRLDVGLKSSELYPEFTPSLVASMREETDRVVEHVVWEGEGTLAQLLTWDRSFVDAKLAAVYGVSHSGAPGFEETQLDPEQRAGVLTHAAVLAGLAMATRSSPVLRGRFVRERLLCESLNPPPPGAVAQLPPLDPGSTTRARFEQHVIDPACAGCHLLMDPIGFGFEGYDAIGAFRTEEDGVPVDVSGIVHGVEPELAFEGAVELAGQLADHERVEACYARQWFRYGFGRREDSVQDVCSLELIDEAMRDSDGDIRELLVSLTLTEAFRFRMVEETEQ